MLVRASSGSGGGGSFALDTAFFTGYVSASRTYTFTKDFKYILLVDVSGISNPLWYEYIRINGNLPSQINGGEVSGTIGGASGSYTVYATIPNIKNGDTLNYTNGTFNFFVVGFN